MDSLREEISLMIPNRRFRHEPMTAQEAIDWLQSHSYVWYQAPMDHSPRRVSCTRLKLWKRSPERFSVKAEVWSDGTELRFVIDNEHLDRIRMPFELWHHGIAADVQHEHVLANGYVSHDSKRGLLKRGEAILKTRVVLNQSNGFHLRFDKLAHAVSFARGKAMELTVRYGRKVRVLVAACAPISGERNF